MREHQDKAAVGLAIEGAGELDHGEETKRTRMKRLGVVETGTLSRTVTCSRRESSEVTPTCVVKLGPDFQLEIERSALTSGMQMTSVAEFKRVKVTVR